MIIYSVFNRIICFENLKKRIITGLLFAFFFIHIIQQQTKKDNKRHNLPNKPQAMITSS